MIYTVGDGRYVTADTLGELEARLRQLAQPGDLILTVGAGELNLVADALTQDCH